MITGTRSQHDATVRLIEELAATSRALEGRDFRHPAVRAALRGLVSDRHLAAVLIVAMAILEEGGPG